MASVRTTPGMLVVLTLTGCAAERVSLETAPAPKELSIPGRWILTAPGVPTCGLEFGGAPSGRAGSIAPDGGCPGNFYMSRRWAMEDGALTIADTDNQPLAKFKFVGAHFEGESPNGVPMILSR